MGSVLSFGHEQNVYMIKNWPNDITSSAYFPLDLGLILWSTTAIHSFLAPLITD